MTRAHKTGWPRKRISSGQPVRVAPERVDWRWDYRNAKREVVYRMMRKAHMLAAAPPVAASARVARPFNPVRSATNTPATMLTVMPRIWALVRRREPREPCARHLPAPAQGTRAAATDRDGACRSHNL